MLVQADSVFDSNGVPVGLHWGDVFGRADWCVVSLSLITYVFGDKMTRHWSVWSGISFCVVAPIKHNCSNYQT